ncbi:pyridoxamine 5'-phosphate oxidase family protein [Clostridium sp. 'deep sea']|uniref:pyridoxamine 5'-phosphate oxidase family protein n=1 Tax=Clostridium sp. 'deep sea' TaxID=2779445 RepID=UPI001896816B|nr:pyridoxamine 5'-phosphate oxidase family protein [Clostridium sp. 'deep sea']QOR34359.1 pyridoxamine 5'-phosphate oxidase family protein [Clostridium sp. 'deep sea']
MSKYHMRRKDLLIDSKSELVKILKQGKYTTLALCRNNEPYVVTMSYAYSEQDNALYMHCAQKGLKLDFINENPAVCATVIEDKGYLEGLCDQKYSSVVIRGKLEYVNGVAEIRKAFLLMVEQLESNPEPQRSRIMKIGDSIARIVMLKLSIEEITGRHSRK